MELGCVQLNLPDQDLGRLAVQAREELAKLGVPLDLAGSEGSPSKGGVPLPQRPATSSRAPYWKVRRCCPRTAG